MASDQCARLLGQPAIVRELVETVGAADDAEGRVETELLKHMLDAGRLNAESGGRLGRPVFDAAGAALAAAAATFTRGGLMALGRCYSRASIPVPAALSEALVARLAETAEAAAPPEMAAVLDQVEAEAGGDAYGLHAALDETLASLPADARAAVLRVLIGRGGEIHQQMALYWLLHPEAGLRCEAGEVLRTLALAGTLAAPIADRVVDIRSWLPADAARDAVDEAIQTARRAGIGAAPRPAAALDRVLATIPDGAGAQTVAVATSSSDGQAVAMVLLKHGEGVKDAYMVPCTSPDEQNRMLTRLAELDAVDVTPAILTDLLAAAIAESLAAGAPPAHGLTDVAAMSGLDELRPQTKTPADWLALADPEDRLAALSKQARGRRITESADWPNRFALVETWFEGGGLVGDMGPMPGSAALQGAVRRGLEARRGRWAELMLRAAAVLRAAGAQADALAFAATGQALLDGRPLKKTPIMSYIADASVDMYYAESAAQRSGFGGQAGELAAGSDQDDEEVETEGTAWTWEAAEPAASGELERVLADAGRPASPDWLDGYVAAVAIAPRPPELGQWLNALLAEADGLRDAVSAARFVDLILQRYATLQQQLDDVALVRETLEAKADDALQAWAQGLCDGMAAHSEAWPQRALRGDDKTVLRTIRAIAEGQGATTPPELIASWLAARAGAM